MPLALATKTIFVCFSLAAVAFASPAQDTRQARNSIQTENNLLDATYHDCLQKDTYACLKYKVLSFADKVIGVSSFDITEGIQVVKTSNPEESEKARALNADASLPSIVLNKVETFLDTHTFKIDLNGKELARSLSAGAEEEEIEYEDGEEIEESRGKKGKKKIKKITKKLGPLIPLVALKGLFLAKLALLGLALLAGKALIMGKIALLISGFLAIKKLFGMKGDSSPIHTESHVYSHETVHPVSDHGHSYGGSASGGWGRSAQDLAYSAYTPETQ